jgi:hypothetical protein
MRGKGGISSKGRGLQTLVIDRWTGGCRHRRGPTRQAQTPPPARRVFEVASIKPNNSGPPRAFTDQFTFSPNGRFTATNVTLVALVNTLANILHEPVVDGTGITGVFDFALDPMQFAATDDPKVPNNVAELVLTAVQEQLGLKLEKRKAPLEITVVDHAEKPSDN